MKRVQNVDVVERALRSAVYAANEDAATMRAVSAAIRAGEDVGMFATGEAGARAADALAAEHDQFREDCLAELAYLQEQDEE